MSQILIVGSGVVGTATGKGFIKKGHTVSFVDIDHKKIEALRSQGLNAMTNEDVELDEIDVVMLTVSTPTVRRKIVLDYIKSAAHDIGVRLAQTDRYITVVVRSTVPPSTTEQVLKPVLEKASGKQAGVGFGLAMNPEFLRQRSNERDFDQPWITVLGSKEPKTMEMLQRLYQPFGGLVVTCTPTEAEMIKYVNNVYNAVKISYFNEVHAICQKMGLDANLVPAIVARSAESMWNPLYGTRGGVPYGGTCLPKDTLAFMEFCDDHGFSHRMLEATIAVNEVLESHVPAVDDPEKIEAALKQARLQPNGTVITTLTPAAAVSPVYSNGVH